MRNEPDSSSTGINVRFDAWAVSRETRDMKVPRATMNQVATPSSDQGRREAQRVHRPGQEPDRPEQAEQDQPPADLPGGADHLGPQDRPAVQRGRDQAVPRLPRPLGGHPLGGDSGGDQQREELDPRRDVAEELG